MLTYTNVLPRTYLHRVGRTARGHNSGHALTMLKLGQRGVYNRIHQSIQPSLAQQQLLQQQHGYLASGESNSIILSSETTSSSSGSGGVKKGHNSVLKTRADSEVEAMLTKAYTRALKSLAASTS